MSTDIRNSVVNCSAYRGGKKLDEISIEDISDVLREPDTFVWVGLFEPDYDLLRKRSAKAP